MYSMQSIEEYRGQKSAPTRNTSITEYRGQKSAPTTDTTITLACRSGRLTAIRPHQLFKSSM